MEVIEFNAWEKSSYMREEAMRTLRTNIQFCGDNIQTILVTSTTQDEGKSTVTMELARSVTELDRKVLLIEGDLRRSSLLGRYRAKTRSGSSLYGLSHYLSGQKSLSEVLCTTKSLPNMHLVFAGPTVPNPAEMLDNHYFDELIEFGRKH